MCMEKPEICPAIFDPVCGCDGQTYGNACQAAAAGVSVDHSGPCSPPVCSDNSQCSESQYCNKALNDCNGNGQCTDKPQICPDIFDPVCGCDGNTYSNFCEAAAAGVNIVNQGPCQPNFCNDNIDCNPGTVCIKLEGDCNGQGQCQPQPDVCVQVYDPVCGCDGQTYGNSCEAIKAGVSIDHFGECQPSQCIDNNDCDASEFCAKPDCQSSGHCLPKPDVCIQVFDPVCGCDGQTYGNACLANAAGTSVNHAGPCIPGDCTDNSQCAPSDYCQKNAGCAGNGTCAPKPQVCPDIFDPVCGCNGLTYGNACEATAAGVNVAHAGPCPINSCTDNDGCDPGFYCDKTNGDCGGNGVCTAIPQACPDVFDPVCGCDGITYGNACEAAAAGVNVIHNGPCVDICVNNEQCEEGQFCNKGDNNCNGVGECTTKPGICPLIYDPVCGCDGNTYSNSCFAAMAGVNVAHDGACAPPACNGNSDCEENAYCDKDAGDCNGSGVCSPKPDICPEIFDPVCGCDGQTYSNACFAAKAGVSIAHEGPCTPSECESNAQCGANDYCEKDGCDGLGNCSPKPQACPEIFDPVCGCDGQTYSNACFAAAAGVNVKHDGPCTICVDPPLADFDGDCKVKINDFAIFASMWCDCALIPTSACNDN